MAGTANDQKDGGAGFGQRLRELRQARGLTQAQLAAAVSTDTDTISRESISQWEKGKVSGPSNVATARRLDEVLEAAGELVTLYGVDDDLLERVRHLEATIAELVAVVSHLEADRSR